MMFTCKMVSKLKVSPFHKVNSPLDAPVTRRRPSGVHWRDDRQKQVIFVGITHKQGRESSASLSIHEVAQPKSMCLQEGADTEPETPSIIKLTEPSLSKRLNCKPAAIDIKLL